MSIEHVLPLGCLGSRSCSGAGVLCGAVSSGSRGAGAGGACAASDPERTSRGWPAPTSGIRRRARGWRGGGGAAGAASPRARSSSGSRSWRSRSGLCSIDDVEQLARMLLAGRGALPWVLKPEPVRIRRRSLVAAGSVGADRIEGPQPAIAVREEHHGRGWEQVGGLLCVSTARSCAAFDRIQHRSDNA